jgi:hypothetical protein
MTTLFAGRGTFLTSSGTFIIFPPKSVTPDNTGNDFRYNIMFNILYTTLPLIYFFWEKICQKKRRALKKRKYANGKDDPGLNARHTGCISLILHEQKRKLQQNRKKTEIFLLFHSKTEIEKGCLQHTNLK